jgi:hypothetical protein
MLADTVTIDEAIVAWRGGLDAVAAKRKQIIGCVQDGELKVPKCGESACPSKCNQMNGSPAP